MTPRQHKLHEQNAHARFEDEIAEDKIEQQEVEVKDHSEPKTSSTHDHHSAPDEEPLQDPAPATDGAADVKDPEDFNQGNAVEAGSLAQPEPVALPRKKLRPTGLSMPPSPDPRSFSRHWDGTHSGGPTDVPSGSMPPSAAKSTKARFSNNDPAMPHLHNLNSPYYVELERTDDYLGHHAVPESRSDQSRDPAQGVARSDTAVTLPGTPTYLEKTPSRSINESLPSPKLARYTTNLKHSPPKSYIETLRPWNGRLSKANWFLVALRPFILFAYPSVLWSTLVYSLSIGWLIVLSEAISNIYRSRDTYNFTALQAGLVYISPFVGGILGTAVAGRVSDVIVRFMARKNGGVYEPEFRLVMAIPVAISTAVGLMGFGWSAQERDAWIVPTIFFGVVSFGCSLGSTTSITFCVDSYRQYAGEALVTLNFSKNIFHGLVFSLFFANWLEEDGPKTTFLAIGGIQLACMVTAIPMYIYGKRARMWTVRRAFMENF
ncbi:hypothetical protein AYL99_05062 [Fonsecaea erecta]|uniref:Major facilitator superfamily (MFS) profile domain-containing protein n=1 Tax=Fonsecaea erecta TaxID=1367422 RepID=A0A178ZJT7_9EURO|nr:hypothetical protein AYL99_05062 [Fonsecaea erecta]OAP60060.1 hypothetical protein AYL99_05062 [Fonsecaea erecta]